MQTKKILGCYLVAAWLCVSTAAVVQSDENRGNDKSVPASDAPATTAKRWYTNLGEAKRAATDSGRPIMVVFR